MKENDLRKVVENLLQVIATFRKYEVPDSRLTGTYAEMLTAFKLSEKGYEVQVRNEHENTNADLYLPRQNIRVEVKTSGGAPASASGTKLSRKNLITAYITLPTTMNWASHS